MKQQNGPRLLYWIVGEIAGILLLIAVVLLIASMPPMVVAQDDSSLLGTSVHLDTRQWGQSITTYLGTIKSGTLGRTYKNQDVGPIVAEKLGNSLRLVAVALGIAVVLGVLKGFWDFRSAQKRAPIAPMITSAVQGLPDFWLILMLQLASVWMVRTLHWNPFRVAWSSSDPFSSLVYPVIALSLIPSAYLARVTSTAMANVYDREYIRTARAKGLHEFTVVFRHVLRNALVQILDGLPGVMAVMVSNLLIVEHMFGYPGLTALLRDAVSAPPPMFQMHWAQNQGQITYFMPNSDVPLLVASGVTLGVIFSMLYLIVGILRRVIDPRLGERERS